MKSTIGLQLQALGRSTLPRQIKVSHVRYSLKKVFKHDFFAVTALYERQNTSDNNIAGPAGVVLKISRTADFLGLPLRWLGQAVCRNEISILKSLQGLPGIPRLTARFGRIGFVYEYIEGTTLDNKPQLTDDFFDRLENLIKQIHARNIAYVDMNKLSNILIGSDNQPYIIDFQISRQINWLLCPLRKFILEKLQNEDFYHLNKHKRHLMGHLMTPEQMVLSRRISPLIRIHRSIARPIIKLRRHLLGFLGQNNFPPSNHPTSPNPETKPER